MIHARFAETKRLINVFAVRTTRVFDPGEEKGTRVRQPRDRNIDDNTFGDKIVRFVVIHRHVSTTTEIKTQKTDRVFAERQK